MNPVHSCCQEPGTPGVTRSAAPDSLRDQCAAVIPCFNEAGTVGPLVKAVRQHVAAAVVVDDGSRDETALVAARAGAVVLRHTASRGKGNALQAGWSWARERGFQWALSLDGDGQHSPDDVPALLASAQRTGAKLVVGNRMGSAERMPWLRRLVNRWMSRRISNLAGMMLPDSQCGFRLMHLDTWSELGVAASHFEIESEVLLGFARARERIEFVPVEVIYRNEQSKIAPVRDSLRWVRWWRRARQGTSTPRTLGRCRAT